MAEIIKTERCPSCAEMGKDTDGDNLVTFESGVQYCVAEKITFTGNMKNKKKEKPEGKFLNGKYIDLGKRKISKKTCEYAGYMVNAEKKVQIANYYDEAGKLVCQKMRTPDKKFPSIGDKDYLHTLWGMNQYSPSDQVFITITEGEIDRLSVLEAFDCRYPVVSVSLGAGSAKDNILNSLHILNKFKYVVLAFDNDKAGVEATEECIPLFEPGKVRVAKWPTKDANDLLKEGKTAEIRKVIYNASEYLPKPILNGSKLLDSLEEHKVETRPWPWDIANKKIQLIYIPGITTIAAKPKMGKTELVGEVANSFIQRDEKAGIISLEQTIPQITITYVKALTGVDLSKKKIQDLTDEEFSAVDKVLKNMVVYDHVKYGSDMQTIIDNIPYMTKGLGCQFLIFDNLSFAASGLNSDERIGIDRAMIELKAASVKYNTQIFNVAHLKRTEFEDDRPCVEDLRGSQGIEMYSDYIIGLWRDKSSDDDIKRNTLEVHILADRTTGQDTGKMFKLRYNHEKRKLEDL